MELKQIHETILDKVREAEYAAGREQAAKDSVNAGLYIAKASALTSLLREFGYHNSLREERQEWRKRGFEDELKA